MRGVYYRTEKDGTVLATPELRISATNNRTVYYDDQTAKEAAMQAGEIKEGSIVLTGYADGEAEVLMKQNVDWDNKATITAATLASGYAAPADGIICISGTSPDNNVRGYVTINGIQVSSSIAGASVGYRESQTQIAVNEGDIIRTVDGNGNAQTWMLHITSIFVPFKTVAEPMTLPVNVLNNPSLPDYSRAVTLTISQFPYTAPSNGVVMMSVNSSSTATGGSGDRTVYVNGQAIASLIAAISSGARPSDLYLPLSRGDIVSFSNSNADVNIRSGHFIPFKN